MFERLARRGVLGRLLAGLLDLFRPAAVGAAAWPHPVHQPLCAARPGGGLWYRICLRLVCPRCCAAVTHRGYLPGTASASCTPVVPPDHPVPSPAVTTFTYDGEWQPRALVSTGVYDAAGRLVAIHDPPPA